MLSRRKKRIGKWISDWWAFLVAFIGVQFIVNGTLGVMYMNTQYSANWVPDADKVLLEEVCVLPR